MPLSRQRCVKVAAPYKPYVNKIVQFSRADDIRPYTIVLIYNTKRNFTRQFLFYYLYFYYISVLARGTRSGFGVRIAEGYRADSAQGFGQIPLAQ